MSTIDFATATVGRDPQSAIIPLASSRDMDLLTADVAENGWRDGSAPIIVRTGKGDTVMIVDGWHRYLAFKATGKLEELQYTVIDGLDGEGCLDLALSANLHRRNMTPEMVALVLTRIAAHKGEKPSVADIARRSGMSTTKTANVMRVAANDPDAAKDMLDNNRPDAITKAAQAEGRKANAERARGKIKADFPWTPRAVAPRKAAILLKVASEAGLTLSMYHTRLMDAAVAAAKAGKPIGL